MPADDAIVELEDDWARLTTPSRPLPGRNEVFYCEDTSRVDEVVADYARRGLPWKWSCFPHAAGLGDALERHATESWRSRAMVFSGHLPGGDDVEEVSERTLGEFLACSEEGWGHSAGQSADLAAAFQAGTHRFFLGRVDGAPAGTSALAEQPGLSYLMGAQVLPRFRRRGVYRGLLAARIRAANNVCGTLAREATSVPVLEKVGFETVVRYRMFQRTRRS